MPCSAREQHALSASQSRHLAGTLVDCTTAGWISPSGSEPPARPQGGPGRAGQARQEAATETSPITRPARPPLYEYGGRRRFVDCRYTCIGACAHGGRPADFYLRTALRSIARITEWAITDGGLARAITCEVAHRKAAAASRQRSGGGGGGGGGILHRLGKVRLRRCSLSTGTKIFNEPAHTVQPRQGASLATSPAAQRQRHYQKAEAAHGMTRDASAPPSSGLETGLAIRRQQHAAVRRAARALRLIDSGYVNNTGAAEQIARCCSSGAWSPELWHGWPALLNTTHSDHRRQCCRRPADLRLPSRHCRPASPANASPQDRGCGMRFLDVADQHGRPLSEPIIT